MDSLQATAASIRAAVSSPSTYTPATATILSDLLLPKSDGPYTTTTTNSKKPTISAAATKLKTGKTPVGGRKKIKVEVDIHEDDQLSLKERSILATEVINAALKSLSDAIKTPAPGPVRKQASSKDLIKASARKALRRSNSLPPSPLQPRSLNRVSSSPSISTRESRSSSSASITSSGHRATGECARVAFACLRTLQASKTPGIDFSPLQLENGMSVMIGRLVSLGLDDLATKELRILKRRLDAEVPKKAIKSNVAAATPTLAELLDFGNVQYTGTKLGLVVTTQLQVLRLMTNSRKPKQTEAALPILAAIHPSSPTRLLLLAAKESKEPKQIEKITRQLQALSEILLSLTPSVSPADDALALESRLSVAPMVAIQLQTLALHNRFLWWGLAGHKGDLSKELYDPFLRCLSTFARRSQSAATVTYSTAFSAFGDLHTLLSDCSDTAPRALMSVLVSIYRLLGSLAKEANNVEMAISWTEHVQRVMDPKVDSDAKRWSVLARLVSLKLRKPSNDPKDEELILNLLEGLESPFKGDSSEIDDLMNEVSSARRSAITLFTSETTALGRFTTGKLSHGLRQMCESLIFLCPRLCLRYLGNSPDINSATKDIVRHEQRRQFITKPAAHAIDSTLFLIRKLLSEEALTWELMDSKLQGCILLLDRLHEASVVPQLDDGYYVRISNLYFTQYLNLRRSLPQAKADTQVRALRRSIDCLRTRPSREKKAGQFSAKLEKLAEWCRATARHDELFKTLSTLRNEMIDAGALSTIAANAAFRPIWIVWTENDEASMLGRTIHYLLKLQIKHLKNISLGLLFEESWSIEERGAVLEHQLEILCSLHSESEVAEFLLLKVLRELVSIYDRRQYPIRRLRVLIRMLSEELDRKLRDEMKDDLRYTQIADLFIESTKDEGLRGYLTHFKTLAVTVMELQQNEPKIDVLTQSLETWISIRTQCKDMPALERQIDYVPGLLSYFHSIADYFQMKGLNTNRISALRLITEINELSIDDSCPDDLVLSFATLGSQWLQMGYSGKAGLSFDRAKNYNHRNGVTPYASLQLHLSYSEYLLSIGSLDKCEDNLVCSQAMYSEEQDHLPKSQTTSMLQARTKMNVLISNAYLVYSTLALERGTPQAALAHAKQSVRLLRRAWANVEEQLNGSRPTTPEATSQNGTEKSAEELSQLNISQINIPTKSESQRFANGSSFWALIIPLFRALSHLSGLFAHNGMFQETVYYAEQARKLVKDVGADAHLTMASAMLGSNWLRAGVLDKGSEFLIEAKNASIYIEQSRETAILSCHLGTMHGLLGDRDAESKAYEDAAKVLEYIATPTHIDNFIRTVDISDELEEKMSQMTISKRKPPVTRKAASRPRTAGKRKTTAGATSPVEVIPSVAEVCPQLTSLRARVLRQKAHALMADKKYADALNLLHEAENFVKTHIEAVDHGLATARQLLLQSIEQMNADPVYSVLQDSTISFPSITGAAKADKHGDRLSVAKVSPPRKLQGSKNSKDRARSKSPAPHNFFDKLRQAQEQLTEMHSVAMTFAPMASIHKISVLLNSVSILLSAAGQVKGRLLAHPGFASYSIETTRTLALRRESKAIQADPHLSLKTDVRCWPTLSCCDSRKSSLGFPCDMTRFQKDYIDIIPKSWTVISVSLSDSRNELSITKFQAGHSPFVLRLPLGRHNSMDADEEVFGFEQGHAELMEVLALANESAHDARDRTAREAKIEWWEEREGLDSRLRDLLENIEKVWLGGFTGIFSQHARRPDLLARFQKSFQNILDKYLPSRRKAGKRNTGPRITLDSRILELFIGLGDASDEECDFSEPLTDLLYFVVDVLQFHGELNAYAEIDFDSIVVETLDALRCYHEAIWASGPIDEDRHTVLILDKALHSFPWESLPCMNGLAVSRLPSLGCLRDRILEQQKDMPEDAPEGKYIRRDNGSYILNPSGDLKHTQATFGKKLLSLKHWDGVIGREPIEEELRSRLESKDLMLYFGHGSGAQYIRAREIRKLEKCAVTILMGCSSGALVDAGEFEPYGPPINYMHAGCPALVATLWDVTDKDIDRFAQSTFEHWGLFEPDTTGAGKKGKKKGTREKDGMSLVEAVAKGREACHLRYLNAASVCVYGVPVYIR